MHEFMKNIFAIFQRGFLRFCLLVVFLLLLAYLTCPPLRAYLSANQIDPNFIIGFFTVITILLSLIQASRDKRYAYNLQLIKSIEDKGLFAIAKLINIKNKSLVYLGTLKLIKSVLGTGQVYKDTNEVFSKSDVEKDMELAATYIDTFFPNLKQEWNDLLDIFSKLGTLSTNTLLNYNENQTLIGKAGFHNYSLENIDDTIAKAEALNQEIDKSTLKIRDSIVEKINISTGEFRKFFEFKL